MGELNNIYHNLGDSPLIYNTTSASRNKHIESKPVRSSKMYANIFVWYQWYGWLIKTVKNISYSFL